VATTVEVLADAFKAAGTPFIVGHPGGESVELMEAGRQRQMRFLLMKQEVAGAMLAATWGEITGSPGVCLSTRGPGAANMVNGVAHALLDRAPLIAITDAYSRPTYETGLRQRINQLAVYAPLVKWSTTIDAKTVSQQVRRAMRTATALPPGPVHFELPQSETTREAGTYAAEPPLLPKIIHSRPDRSDLKPALDMIARAKRPILIVGLGVLWAKASPELVRLAERIGAPVLTTPKCKGAIPEDHALRAGCIIGGLIERNLVNASDLIITVGLDAVELQPKPWPYTLPVLAFYLLMRFKETGRERHFAGAIVSAAVAGYCFANGLMAWPALVFESWLLGLSRKLRLIGIGTRRTRLQRSPICSAKGREASVGIHPPHFPSVNRAGFGMDCGI
jgi:acetolactate synthase-1/2/3 large subunit